MKLCEFDKALLTHTRRDGTRKPFAALAALDASGECSPAPTDAPRPATELQSA
jgi:hypothetical protein